jgi:hypothetical protein
MRKVFFKYLTYFLLFASFSLFHCAPRLQLVERGRYSDPHGYFDLTLPEDGWELLSWENVDFAVWVPNNGATIVVNVTPLQEDVDAATLTRHLLIAFERKHIISQGVDKVDGREAVKTVLEGWVEGTKVKAEVYVVRGEGVVYDIIFWAPRDAFPRTVEAFHHVLAGIDLH